MDLFKRGAKVVDERLASIENKVYKEAYILVIGICLVSMVVKTFVLGQSYLAIVTEGLVLVLSSIYYWLRVATLGVYRDAVELEERNSKYSRTNTNLYIALVAGLAIAIMFGVRSAMIYGDENTRLYYFVLVFLAAMLMYLPFFLATIVLPDIIDRRLGKKPHDNE